MTNSGSWHEGLNGKGVVSRHDGPDKETKSQPRPGGRQEATKKERNILDQGSSICKGRGGQELGT